jgi:uncharacterized protein (DUF433 family)
MEWHERIVTNPDVLVGKPVIKGTRLAVEFVIDLLAQGWSYDDILAQGWSYDDILANYPGISREDVLACLAYASERLHAERVYPR